MNEIRAIKESVLRELIQVTGQVSATIARGNKGGFRIDFPIGDAGRSINYGGASESLHRLIPLELTP